MGKYRQHFFVCTNTRPPFAKPSCGGQGSTEIIALLKDALEERKLKGEVRACSSSCLGPCEDGPVVVVYPEATWYSGVTPEDVPEIVNSHIVNGEPVKRLLYDQHKEE